MTRRQSGIISLDNCAVGKRLIRLSENATTVSTAVQVLSERLLADVPCPPTKLEDIFPKVNVVSCYGEDIWGSGELRREGKHFAIVYNNTHSVTRRRFSIAHELGHALLETGGPNCPRSGEHVERVCDMIASELLMPQSRFVAMVNGDVSVKKIIDASQAFQTSLMATAVRFSELFKVSVFLANEESISWSFGAARKANLLSDAKECVEKAMNRENGSEKVVLSTKGSVGEWQLHWMPLGQSKQALFLAKPERRYRHFT